MRRQIFTYIQAVKILWFSLPLVRRVLTVALVLLCCCCVRLSVRSVCRRLSVTL